MSSVELQEFADDIKQNGLANPIVRYADGLIVDGRNRVEEAWANKPKAQVRAALQGLVKVIEQVLEKTK